MLGISEVAKQLGGHGIAVLALERMESGRTIDAGWLQQFIRKDPRHALHEEMKNGLMHLSTEQLPLFNALCNAVLQMGSRDEIASFPGDAPTVLLGKPGEEMRVLDPPKFIGVELVSDDDSSEEADDGGDKGKEPEVEKETGSTQTPVEETNENQPINPPNQDVVHLMILDENQAKNFPMYAMVSSAMRKLESIHNISAVRTLEKEILDADSLILETNVNEEVTRLKKENAQLKRHERIGVSLCFLKKFDILSLVAKQIQVRTERSIAKIKLLKKRTKEAEFFSKQSAILQNILVNREIPLPILEDLDEGVEAKERTALEEYLL
ncbi:OLC1v1036159C1 [Oldenlandia corymbosa var. corymbosa]|uniref:OLC1v1036159C1 n=1 Tax=Oldenlandia corymbosa var. corymbosa TaxID=529605 RepID=A0AAV1CV27_OLDCO|nr:OLC1v1036159C1 [Oldenlandia corymbosa var. corymbosa]